MSPEYAHFRDREGLSMICQEGVADDQDLVREYSAISTRRFLRRSLDDLVVGYEVAVGVVAPIVIEQLADAHLVTWWNHRNAVAAWRSLARDPVVAMHAYNDGLWATLAKRIGGKRLGRPR